MKKKVFYFVLTVFMIVIAAVFILLQPYLKTAFSLGKALRADSTEFEAEVCLNAAALSENEKGFIDVLEWIFQVEGEELLNLRFTGSGTENKRTVTVYCDAVKCPLTEIYYGEDQGTVNMKMFYEAVEESLPDKLWLLKTLLPEWNLEEETVSFEQLKAFGIDLEDLVPFGKTPDLKETSTMQYIYLLSQLEKEKDEKGDVWFLGNYENYSFRFCVKENEDGVLILLRGETVGEDQKMKDFKTDILFVL